MTAGYINFYNQIYLIDIFVYDCHMYNNKRCDNSHKYHKKNPEYNFNAHLKVVDGTIFYNFIMLTVDSNDFISVAEEVYRNENRRYVPHI